MTAVELLLAQRKMFFEGTEMVVAGIKPEWFDHRPAPEMMSFGELVDHMASVEAELLDETATALESNKIPFDFHQSKEMSAAVSQWKRIHGLGDQFIAGLDDEKLEFRFLTVSHVHVSVAHMINVVLEHELHHRGEIVAYFRIMDQEPPKRWRD
jgi:uncharacterized damage-inducible protein DinB